MSADASFFSQRIYQKWGLLFPFRFMNSIILNSNLHWCGRLVHYTIRFIWWRYTFYFNIYQKNQSFHKWKIPHFKKMHYKESKEFTSIKRQVQSHNRPLSFNTRTIYPILSIIWISLKSNKTVTFANFLMPAIWYNFRKPQDHILKKNIWSADIGSKKDLSLLFWV